MKILNSAILLSLCICLAPANVFADSDAVSTTTAPTTSTPSSTPSTTPAPTAAPAPDSTAPSSAPISREVEMKPANPNRPKMLEELHKPIPAFPNWQSLKDPQPLSPVEGNSAVHYRFHAPNGSRVDLVVADMNIGSWQLKPAISDRVQETSEKGDQDKATVAVNGGYFDMEDEASASYVVIDGKLALDPGQSGTILKSIKAGSFPQYIFNRSELRLLMGSDGKIKFDVAPHTVNIPAGYTLQHSLQAGPNLLTEDAQFDELALTKEGFLKEENGKQVDAINCRGEDARTAIGVTADGHILIACVADKTVEPDSVGLSIRQLAEMMRDLGCVKALNLDGGRSTSMFVRHGNPSSATTLTPGETAVASHPARPVKSFMELRHTSVITGNGTKGTAAGTNAQP